MAMKKALIAACLAGSVAAPAAAQTTTFNWGGYAKLDVIYSSFSDAGNNAPPGVAQGVARDFYVPGAIPVSDGTATGLRRNYLDMHAKETRLFLSTQTDVGTAHKLGGHVEFDFISGQINQGVVGAGTEAVTNAYNPALRRAFVTYDKWLFGQDWSTFTNLGAIPETLDFVAFASDGTTFVRQPMIRYTHGPLEVSLENGNTTVVGIGLTNDNVAPDLHLRYRLKSGAADLAVAAVVRQLKERTTGVDDTEMGYGLSLSGKLGLGARNDIRFMVNGGSGVGRYLALGTSSDAAVDANGQLEALDVMNAYLALRHAWTSQWRSNLVLSAFKADDNALLAGATTETMNTVALNLLYSPVAKLTIGAELRHGERETISGLDGELSRLQFSTKYIF
jgi:hypothetical protein